MWSEQDNRKKNSSRNNSDVNKNSKPEYIVPPKLDFSEGIILQDLFKLMLTLKCTVYYY